MLVTVAVLAVALVQEPTREAAPQLKRQALEAEQHYRSGLDALGSERFELAEEEFKEAVRLDPTLFLAHYSLGKTYMNLKRYDEAVRAYTNCRETWTQAAGDQTKRQFDTASKREDQVRELRDRIRQLEGDLRNARSENEKIAIQQRMDNIRLGIDSLERMRGNEFQTPQPPAEFALALGSAYLRMGAVDDAEREYSEAVRIKPKYGEAHNNLAVIYLKKGDFGQAREHVKAAERSGFKVHPELKKAIEQGASGKR